MYVPMYIHAYRATGSQTSTAYTHTTGPEYATKHRPRTQ